MINNGDGARSAYHAGIKLKNGEPFSDVTPFTGQLHVRYSTTLAHIVALVGAVNRIVSDYFYLSGVTLILLLIFLFGLYQLLKLEVLTYRQKLGIVVVNLLNIFLFGFYFRSLYEESATLSLVPWLCYGVGLFFSKHNKKIRSFIGPGVLLVYSKAQMIFLIPILIFVLRNGAQFIKTYRHKKILISLGSLVGVGIFTFVNLHADLKIPNSYNRFFSGVGSTVLGIENWPPRSFSERDQFLNENRSFLQPENMLARKISEDDSRLFKLMGTGYWPTGVSLYAEDASYFSQRIKISYYFSYFLEHPALVLKFLKSSFLVALKSDYSLSYLRPAFNEDYFVYNVLRTFRDTILSYAGWLYFAILLLCLPLAGSTSAFASLWMALAPLFVVFGDGFYEFEKHMAPYLMLLPFIVFLRILNPSKTSLAK